MKAKANCTQTLAPGPPTPFHQTSALSTPPTLHFCEAKDTVRSSGELVPNTAPHFSRDNLLKIDLWKNKNATANLLGRFAFICGYARHLTRQKYIHRSWHYQRRKRLRKTHSIFLPQL